MERDEKDLLSCFIQEELLKVLLHLLNRSQIKQTLMDHSYVKCSLQQHYREMAEGFIISSDSYWSGSKPFILPVTYAAWEPLLYLGHEMKTWISASPQVLNSSCPSKKKDKEIGSRSRSVRLQPLSPLEVEPVDPVPQCPLHSDLCTTCSTLVAPRVPQALRKCSLPCSS